MQTISIFAIYVFFLVDIWARLMKINVNLHDAHKRNFILWISSSFITFYWCGVNELSCLDSWQISIISCLWQQHRQQKQPHCLYQVALQRRTKSIALEPQSVYSFILVFSHRESRTPKYSCIPLMTFDHCFIHKLVISLYRSSLLMRRIGCKRINTPSNRERWSVFLSSNSSLIECSACM